MVEKDICNNCITRTGGCCTNVNLFIHISEVKPFLKAREKGCFGESDKLQQWDGQNDLFVYNSGNEKCHFLSETNTCLIYEVRPTICKLYPIVWKKGLIDSFDIFIDLLCPLAHAKSILDIYSGSLGDKNKELIKKIGSLEFDENDSSYVNITDKKRSSEGLSYLYGEE